MSNSFEHEICQHLAQLTPDQQQDVLSFIRSIGTKSKKGTHGNDLLKFAGAISHDDIEIMRSVIEADCGRIDPNGW